MCTISLFHIHRYQFLPLRKITQQRTAHKLPHMDNMAQVLTICPFYIHTDTCRNPAKSVFHFNLTVMTKYHTINHTVLKNTTFHTTSIKPAVKLRSFLLAEWQLSSTGFKIYQYEVSDQLYNTKPNTSTMYPHISVFSEISCAKVDHNLILN